MLFEILHFDWFGIPAIEVAKLSIEVNERKFNDGKISIRQLMVDKANTPPKDLFTPGFPEKISSPDETAATCFKPGGFEKR